MAISEDLFLAILAMDAYNRGYNEAVTLDPALTQIGNATIGLSSDTLAGSPAVNASFYAQTYTWDGQTIISYRGTDQPSTDIFNGYPTALGLTLDPQAAMAIQFYKSVVAQSGSNVFLTGHSMGAGHAGLVAALFGKDATLFDNMPFQLAAQNIYAVATGAAIWLPVPGLPSLLTGQETTSLVYGNATPWAPTFDQIDNIYIPNYEIGPDTNWLAFARSIWDFVGQGQTIDQTSYPIPFDTPLNWTTYNKVGQRHDASLLVIRMFLGDPDLAETGDWKYASKYLLPALFDQQLANAIEGAADLVGPGALGDVANAMRAAIAYSAIDEGTRVFGDTGIRALKNDATELGSVLKAEDVSNTLKSASEAIGKVITQFAGHLAVEEVMQSSTIVPVTEGGRLDRAGRADARGRFRRSALECRHRGINGTGEHCRPQRTDRCRVQTDRWAVQRRSGQSGARERHPRRDEVAVERRQFQCH